MREVDGQLLPEIDELNRPFWEATRKGTLRTQRCTACGHLRYPLAEICPVCLAAGTEWVTLSGRGEILAHVVFHQVYHPAMADKVPYHVVLVRLDEGVRMFSRLVPADGEKAQVGDRVEVTFEALPDDVQLPVFAVVA